MWVSKFMDHSSSVHTAIATEVIQLPCSGQQPCFIIEVWLVTLTDESALASKRKQVSLSFVVVKE